MDFCLYLLLSTIQQVAYNEFQSTLLTPLTPLIPLNPEETGFGQFTKEQENGDWWTMVVTVLIVSHCILYSMTILNSRTNVGSSGSTCREILPLLCDSYAHVVVYGRVLETEGHNSWTPPKSSSFSQEGRQETVYNLKFNVREIFRVRFPGIPPEF